MTYEIELRDWQVVALLCGVFLFGVVVGAVAV